MVQDHVSSKGSISVIELLEKGKSSEAKEDFVNALDYYVRIDELSMSDSDLGISDEDLDFVRERIDEIYPKVHEIMMKEIDTNKFGKLVAGKHYFTHACCKAMRNLIDKDEVGLDFDDDEICLVMDGKYADDGDDEEPLYTTVCPFCGQELEFSKDFYD